MKVKHVPWVRFACGESARQETNLAVIFSVGRQIIQYNQYILPGVSPIFRNGHSCNSGKVNKADHILRTCSHQNNTFFLRVLNNKVIHFFNIVPWLADGRVYYYSALFRMRAHRGEEKRIFASCRIANHSLALSFSQRKE